MTTPPNLLDIIKARCLLGEYLQQTPIYRSNQFSELLDLELSIKYENIQPIRSFKVRGGLYTMSLLDKDKRGRGVITASTGNHGQGIANGGLAMGIPVTIVVPRGPPNVKREAIIGLGAELITHGTTISDSFKKSQEIATKTGMIYIEDGEDFGLMAGAGTIGLEILEEKPDTEIVVLPVGGGNLIAGVGTAIKAINPDVQIIGVQASKAPSVYQSWQEGHIVTTETCETFAGGLATTFPGTLAFNALKNVVDGLQLVSEEEMKQVIPVILDHTGYVAEGAAAAVFALCMREARGWRGKRVVALFSGGNLDIKDLEAIMRNLPSK